MSYRTPSLNEKKSIFAKQLFIPWRSFGPGMSSLAWDVAVEKKPGAPQVLSTYATAYLFWLTILCGWTPQGHNEVGVLFFKL